MFTFLLPLPSSNSDLATFVLLLAYCQPEPPMPSPLSTPHFSTLDAPHFDYQQLPTQLAVIVSIVTCCCRVDGARLHCRDCRRAATFHQQCKRRSIRHHRDCHC